jgi:hypothetical protein
MARKRLPSRLNLLSVRAVQTASEGDYSDGGGLLLRVQAASATWVLRYTAPNVSGVKWALARSTAPMPRWPARASPTRANSPNDARQVLQKAIDPIDERDARRAAKKTADEAARSQAKRAAMTLARAAREYHERVIEGHRSEKHAADWINSLEQHVPSAIWQKSIAEVTAPELLDFFLTIRRSHRETGRRVVQRLCKVYSDAVFRGLASGNVVAAASERLRELGIKPIFYTKFLKDLSFQ